MHYDFLNVRTVRVRSQFYFDSWDGCAKLHLFEHLSDSGPSFCEGTFSGAPGLPEARSVVMATRPSGKLRCRTRKLTAFRNKHIRLARVYLAAEDVTEEDAKGQT